MQDVEIFTHMAEIAGVFVGFAALIAVRSGGATGIAEVAYMRGVVAMGMLTVVAALAPVVIGQYGLAPHSVWALCSGLVLAGWVVAGLAMARTAEYRANMAAEFAADRQLRPRWLVAAEGAFFVLFVAASVLLPVAIILGLLPDLEHALYLTVVALVLVGAGWTLLTLVFAQRGAETG